MQAILAARGNIDDWVQLIILGLVLGGSLLSAVAKKLIEHFSQRHAGVGQTKDAPPTQAASPTHPARRGPVTSFPVARPMPPTPGGGRTEKPPMAPRFPMTPVADPEAIAPPPPPRKRPRPAQPAAPVARPAPAGGPPQTRRSSPRPPTARSDAPVATVAASVSAHISAMHSRLEDESAAVDAAVERNLGGLRRRISTRDDPAESAQVEPHGRRFDAHELRRAVVLSEILGPPLSIRPIEPQR